MSAREGRPSVPPVKLTEEQLNALSAAGNRALNDHYHDDLCHCRKWPTSCVSSGSYFMGAWDTGAFDIGLGAVLGLWESMRPDAAADELAELRAERHSTNEALSDAVEQLRVQRDRIAELEAAITHGDPCRPCGCPKRFDRHAWGCPTLPADDVPVLPQQRQAEDPHDGPNHHDYALGRDLPFIPQQTTGCCPHGIPDCICGGAE